MSDQEFFDWCVNNLNKPYVHPALNVLDGELHRSHKSGELTKRLLIMESFWKRVDIENVFVLWSSTKAESCSVYSNPEEYFRQTEERWGIV